jgi:prepilin-type N-terminal cleavage/methylation domain-containing protein
MLPARRRAGRAGFTLVELMVAVAIVIILAAIAIPMFSRQIREAALSEAASNLQGILEAEQAYFVRFQRYTAALPVCPPNPPTDPGQNQDWDLNDCADGWKDLGWSPEKRVYFQYRAFSLYDDDGVKAVLPGTLDMSGAWGIDWAVEFPQLNPLNMEPWVAVEARADTDGDGQPVLFRSNSYNHATFRCNQSGEPPGPSVEPTY